MKIHKNARLTPKGREILVRRIVNGGLRVEEPGIPEDVFHGAHVLRFIGSTQAGEQGHRYERLLTGPFVFYRDSDRLSFRMFARTHTSSRRVRRPYFPSSTVLHFRTRLGRRLTRVRSPPPAIPIVQRDMSYLAQGLIRLPRHPRG